MDTQVRMESNDIDKLDIAICPGHNGMSFCIAIPQFSVNRKNCDIHTSSLM